MQFKNKNIFFASQMFNDQLSRDGDDDKDEKFKQMGVYCSETVTVLLKIKSQIQTELQKLAHPMWSCKLNISLLRSITKKGSLLKM